MSKIIQKKLLEGKSQIKGGVISEPYLLQSKPRLCKPYSKGFYNKHDNNEQWIRLTEGCPNGCEYCRESFENGKDDIYYPIPEIIRNNVTLIDMNFTNKDKVLEYVKELGSKKVNGKVVYYELKCGIDYRIMTDELAVELKKNRFVNIRLAWDHSIRKQKYVKNVVNMLIKAGYNSKDIMIFMICNWKIPYVDNLFKLDLCKIWNVQVSDCYFDNQIAPNIKPIHWDIDQIKDFRKRVRKHNQLVNFGIDPELK